MRKRTRRAKVGAAIAPVFIAAAISGCATTGINTGQINLISDQEEVKMGQDMSVEVSKQFEIYDKAEVTNYVQGVGARLVKVCDRTGIEYHFAVIKKDELNAFALPGGYIYVYTGLLSQLDDESQLAAVLSHEIAHVTARHATERLTAMYGYQIIANLVLGNDPNTVVKLVSDIFSTGGFLAYSRKNEYEADGLAANYSSAAGYDPDGMMELLGKLKAIDEREPGKLEELLSTHPPTSGRIDNALSIIGSLASPVGTLRNAPEYRKMKGLLP